MAKVQESPPLQEIDLDKTDELPVLDMAKLSAPDFDPGMTTRLDPNTTTSDTDRYSRIDLPSLIESVQQAEARIAQQNAHQEILDRELKSSRDKIEESTRDILKLTGEAQALRATLAAREDSLSQAMHTVGDRDHQIAELRRDHAGLQKKFDEGQAVTAKLQEELAAARAQIEQIRADFTAKLQASRTELNATQDSLSALNAQVRQGEQVLAAAQREAETFKRQSREFLENLQSREWQRSTHEDMFRDMDARLAATESQASKFESQAAGLASQLSAAQALAEERLQAIRTLEGTLEKNSESARQQTASLEQSEASRQALLQQLQAREAALAKSEGERTQVGETLASRERSLQEERDTKAQLQTQLQSLEASQAELMARLAEIDRRLDEAQQQKRLDDEALQRQAAALEAARAEAASQLGRISQLEDELQATTSLLDEVRRPIEAAEADIRQLRGELDTRGQELEAARDEIKKLQSQLERSKGALEEREFLIRRLERSANNSAQVLGRLQSSIERLGAPASSGAPAVPPPAAEPAGEVAVFTGTLMRIDNGLATTYALGARTRVGRSPESDVRIDSTSVSRHHALILSGSRHAIIEDLNSTNGVVVNGRKVNRHKLKDGDLVVIGEAQFKYIDTGTLLPEPNPVSFAPS